MAALPQSFQPFELSHISRSNTPGDLSFTLETRQAARCGPSANGASCGSGLCCSPGGLCGTGNLYCGAPGCLFQYGPACDANQSPKGVDTSTVARPNVGNVPYGATIQHCTVPGKVALTFDDGPYLYTSDLIDLLKANNIKATFFIVGNNLSKGQINDPGTGYPALIQRMNNEGHQIASHSWSHQDFNTLTSQQRRDQVIKNEIALADILGFFPTYFRPPYMSCNNDCQSDLGKLGYHVAGYDIDTQDWKENYPMSQQIFLNLIGSTKPATGSWIPLSHDIHNNTVHGYVQFMIDNLRNQGYTTATMGECLGDPKVNWYRNVKAGTTVSPASISSTAIAKQVTNSANVSSIPASLFKTSVATPTIAGDSTSTPAPTSIKSGGYKRTGTSVKGLFTASLVSYLLMSIAL